MAITSGTSVRGLQRLGSFPSASGLNWQVRFASAQNVNRLERQGTLIVCRPISNARFPAIAVFKLFGGGLEPPDLGVANYTGIEVWVNWFIAGRSWFFERPD